MQYLCSVSKQLSVQLLAHKKHSTLETSPVLDAADKHEQPAAESLTEEREELSVQDMNFGACNC